MMERVEVTITIAEGETSGEANTGYVSGLLEGVFVVADTEATPKLGVYANEPGIEFGREIVGSLNLGAGGNEVYPRVPVVYRQDASPVQYAADFPVMEKIPVYGTLLVGITNADPGDTFSVAIYLSNSNPNGR